MPVPKPMERKQAAYSNLDERYAIQGEKYQGQQYSHIYFTRLHHMRNLLHALVPSWKPQLPVTTVLGLEEGKDCIIVGTLYKHMKLKPSILDEYAKERSAIPLVKPHNFMHPDDHLILEDESGRVTLAGAIPPAAFVTGVVVALHGKETSAGNFLVEDVLEAGLPPQSALSSAEEDKYVVFISGLSVGSDTFNPLQFQLLIDHVTGHLGDENLVASLPVDMMPGCHDPANFSLPQQPLHRCLFSGASTYNTFSSCSNPHQFELDSVQFLGTSGQNIDDLYKYSDAKDKLEFMERTLRWRHLAPTAPNSLGCYPYTDKDPFLVESCPHVYFVGNQDKYETRLLEGQEKQKVRLISIPRFSESGVAVMLNLRNLECSTLSFSTSFDA
ncbi:DNA polymerase delta small subunit [Zea mays]|uniref:DNA polymerase delta small subunit n=2 Tax=Zea mays TaxID=4577 RepID=A0A8J8YR31_MAIZE|nr:DNA polymerase delta small subunit [Zea mays]PWZ52519.1 DNA polymerase delta small subunit [Zea mays]